jgi:hypothetical protein
MAKKNKQKRVLEIADELDKLEFPGIAQMLRDAVTSGKTNSNESSQSNEGNEFGGDESDGEGGDGNGSNNPPVKPPFKP